MGGQYIYIYICVFCKNRSLVNPRRVWVHPLEGSVVNPRPDGVAGPQMAPCKSSAHEPPVPWRPMVPGAGGTLNVAIPCRWCMVVLCRVLCWVEC